MDSSNSEYSQSYCDLLEVAYGPNMLSEGGSEAIEHMFQHLDLKNKKALDIGFGLAGAMFYLAKTHHTHITGLEVNP